MYNTGKWSNSEIELLKAYYPIGGMDLCFEKGLNRPIGAIKSKANNMGIYLNNTSEKLTNEELSILKKYYPIGGYLLCLNMGLLNKNKTLVRNTANKLGLKIKDYNQINNSVDIWREDEIWLIVKYYPMGGSALCIEKGLNRSEKSIALKANRLNLSTNLRGTGVLWTEDEDAILIKYYPIGGSALCRDFGVTRDLAAIRVRAGKLGLRYFNAPSKKVSNAYEKWEEDIIKKYYPTEGVKGCIDRGVDRTPDAIVLKAGKMGVKVERRLSRPSEWSDEEIAILKTVYPIYGIKGCIAEGLNRSERSIQHKVNDFKLKRIVRGDWTKEEDAILKQYYPLGGYNLCVSKGLNRKPDATRNRAKFWGITYKK